MSISPFQPQNALITGSTTGIGFAIAQDLAAQGITVIINGRSEERINAAIAKIQRVHPNATLLPLAADLTTAEGVNQATTTYPEVDILVNNLGIFEVRHFNDISDSEWIRFFESNVMSGVRLSRHYLPRMLDKDQGRIVFISSEAGFNILEEMIHYSVSKSAQIALARGLAELTQGTQVTVNTVLPGPTRTEGVQNFLKGLAEQQNTPLKTVEQEFFQINRPTSLIQRFIDPQEIAPLVTLITGPQGGAFNGAALRVEGGIIKSAF